MTLIFEDFTQFYLFFIYFLKRKFKISYFKYQLERLDFTLFGSKDGVVLSIYGLAEYRGIFSGDNMKEYAYVEPKKLQDIENLNRKGTEILWRQYFRATIPKGLSIALAKPILAHEFQVRHLGDLDRKTRTVLKQACKSINRPRSIKFKPGTQLIREWNGVVHKVEVIDEGFLYDGDRYKSLTAIAETITGVHWSGPRFFGTTKPKVVYGKS